MAMLAVLGSGTTATSDDALTGIHKIRHVIVIMQENRSFDSYFGTYPGAEGIPRDAAGKPTVCVPDPRKNRCVAPYHGSADHNGGGPHRAVDAVDDIDGGRMDGFIRVAQMAAGCHPTSVDPACEAGYDEVMAYHDRMELPVYWGYADQFVLLDHLFEPNLGWSLPAHLYMVSGWSASCRVPRDPMSCSSDISVETTDADRGSSGRHDLLAVTDADDTASGPPPDYAWTDITYLLHRAGVSWGYYVSAGTQPDCASGATSCQSRPQSASTPEIWNPLPDFQTVHDDNELANIQDVSRFVRAARSGSLPSVSWVVPSLEVSEHPNESVRVGQAHVKSLVDAVMAGPDWASTAIFVSWDDWGGFYDHVVPPRVDDNGLGLRVPGLIISPFAKKGFVDHHVLSFDSFLRFIEDDFLAGARLDPRTNGRPDPRPSVREASPTLGDLSRDFEFSTTPTTARRDTTPEARRASGEFQELHSGGSAGARIAGSSQPRAAGAGDAAGSSPGSTSDASDASSSIPAPADAAARPRPSRSRLPLAIGAVALALIVASAIGIRLRGRRGNRSLAS
jgi:phospholipase C